MNLKLMPYLLAAAGACVEGELRFPTS